MKEAVGDTAWLSWNCQLLQDSNNYCELLTPGTCCCSVPGRPSLICCASCLPEIIYRQSCQTSCPLSASALAHHLFSHGSVTTLGWFYPNGEKWMFGCCGRLLLLTLKCTVSMPWCGSNPHHNFPPFPCLSFACPWMSSRITNWCQFLDSRCSWVHLSVEQNIS